ncbi:hypothetical protein ASG84_19840 [Rhodococcus sp. Leaf278]|nr:hypothetical protein ASG84_19840 [Rhodococcus sp. Leaf278]
MAIAAFFDVAELFGIVATHSFRRRCARPSPHRTIRYREGSPRPWREAMVQITLIRGLCSVRCVRGKVAV